MFHSSEVARLRAQADELLKRAAELERRGTGRTTATALMILAAAYNKPGLVVQVHDHHGTISAHYSLRGKVLAMAEQLGLLGFVACGMNAQHRADGHTFGIKYIKPTL